MKNRWRSYLPPWSLAVCLLEVVAAIGAGSIHSGISSNTTALVENSSFMNFKNSRELVLHVQQPTKAPAPPQSDYNAETTVIWSGKSSYSLSIEALIGLTWVCMVAALPLIIIKLEGELITKSQMVVFVVMWVAFLGGVVLFTNVVSFQSAHFDTVRSLTIVESVYLLSQILTTVGYGDITPATQTSQVFVACYAVFSLVVIAHVVSQVSELISHHGEKFISEHFEAVCKLSSVGSETSETPRSIARDQDQACSEFFTKTPERLDYTKVIKSGCSYMFFVLLGCLFYHYFPGEGKSWFEGVYMSIITLSTIGFGAITPITEAGKVFGAFWMLFGSASLVALVSSIADLLDQVKLRERWNPDEIEKEEAIFLEDLPEELTEFDFLKRALLYKKLVSESDIDAIDGFWKKLNKASQHGTLSKSALKTIFDRHGTPPRRQDQSGV